jgi:hypothetical protein
MNLSPPAYRRGGTGYAGMTTQAAPASWAPRDASWYARPRASGVPRWHLIAADGGSACGRVPLLDIDRAAPDAPSLSMRCKRCAP